MTDKFIPLRYLDKSDKQLLRMTKKNIKRAQTNADLYYYESVLDNLMKRAVKNYNNQHKQLQEA